MTSPNTNIDELLENFVVKLQSTSLDDYDVMLDKNTETWSEAKTQLQALITAAKESELEQLENDMENSDRPNVDWYREPFECIHDLIDNRRKALKEQS